MVLYTFIIHSVISLYYSSKGGNKLYKQWCTMWQLEAGGTQAPRATQFMADMWLPYWVQCTMSGCGRWRKLPAHFELHHIKLDLVKCNDCTIEEDQVTTPMTTPIFKSMD